MRLLVVILEQSFPFFDEARCSSAFFLGHVVSLCLSSSDEHHRSDNCLGTGMRVCHYRASLDNCIRDIFGVCIFRVRDISGLFIGEAIVVSLY